MHTCKQHIIFNFCFVFKQPFACNEMRFPEVSIDFWYPLTSKFSDCSDDVPSALLPRKS